MVIVVMSIFTAASHHSKLSRFVIISWLSLNTCFAANIHRAKLVMVTYMPGITATTQLLAYYHSLVHNNIITSSN